MRNLLTIVIVAVSATMAGSAFASADVVLSRNAKSEYRIVIAAQASPVEEHAAAELQSFLKRIGGATLPIVTDFEKADAKVILVGRNARLSQIGVRIDWKKLGTDGVVIRTVGSRLVLAGSPARGALYAVYTFLEDQLGCRWFTANVHRIPSSPDIKIGKIDYAHVPTVMNRDLYYGEARDPDFMVCQKLNGLMLDDKRGGKATIAHAPGATGWCHNVFTLCPPDKYFKDHPEYFSMVNGQRTPSELCLTNPEVLEIVVKNLRALMKKYPEYKIWNVSQMDNGDPCTCPACKAIDDREESPAGSVLEFTNKIAARFPDKVISTLAYWYTMGPPKTLKPLKNVHIMFCTDTCRRPPFYDYYKGWQKIAPLRYHWYYVIPCHNIIAPWPNWYQMQRDLKEWAAGGMTGMFIEGSNEVGSEFSELRIYLLSKLLWDQNVDYSKAMQEFLDGYYGAAGPILRRYIDAMVDSLNATGDDLDGHDWCRQHAETFLAPAMLAKYDLMFDDAEKTVASSPDLLRRVQHARLPLMHAELQLGYGSVQSRIDTLYRMKDISLRSGVPFYWDFGNRPTQQYLAEVLAGLEKERAGK
jgi:hypothetical protein